MTIGLKMREQWRGKQDSLAPALRFSPFNLMLKLAIILLFCQIWFEPVGVTVRLEDIVALVLVGSLLAPLLLTGRLRYRRSLLNIPLLLWCVVLLLGLAVTLLSPFDGATKRDALINVVRLILAFGLFFVIYFHPASAQTKLKTVVSSTVLFSFLTTAVALLQMGYWDGWLPFGLPEVLVTFKEGANTEQGRELFALYLGDTGSHTWSAALAMQALLVWLLGRHTKSLWHKSGAWLYFALLVFILVRVSVRNSIFGLFIAIICLELFRQKRTRDLALRLLRPILILFVVVAVIGSLIYLAPDSYFIVRIRQAIPTFEQGQLVISGGSSIFGRIDYWITGLKIFADAPLLGGGFYSYRALSGFYRLEPVVHAHNSYVQTLAELGLVGAFALICLITSIGYYLVRTRHYFSSDLPGKLCWEMVTGSFIFIAFAGLFGNPFWSPNPIAFRMILLGVLASFVRERTR